MLTAAWPARRDFEPASILVRPRRICAVNQKVPPGPGKGLCWGWLPVPCWESVPRSVGKPLQLSEPLSDGLLHFLLTSLAQTPGALV